MNAIIDYNVTKQWLYNFFSEDIQCSDTKNVDLKVLANTTKEIGIFYKVKGYNRTGRTQLLSSGKDLRI